MLTFRNVIMFVAVALAFALSGCGDREKSQPAAPPTITTRVTELPNIIVLTVDTLRADHLARYGYGRDTMPAIEAFCDTAVVFDQAVVSRGATRPSYGSMLTGLYPFHHGVRSNGGVLHDDLLTLPEVLKVVGYHTAAFVSNFVLLQEISGFDQGFDVYDDHLAEREAHRPNFERTAPRTLKAILEWLESDPPQPFFLFTNFIDPHGPYEPPDRYRQMYRSTETRLLEPEQIPAYQRKPGVLDFYDFLDRYDGEISYTDAALGVLIDELTKKELWDDALVIFTADHGESMGEHRVYFEHHQHLWDATVRVPLAVRLPARAAQAAPAPRRVGGVVSPMDLMPTIVDWLEITGDLKFDGRSWLPVLRGAEPDQERVIFLEFPDVTTPNLSHPDVYAVRTDSFKLMRKLDQNTGKPLGQMCFDLANDPNEQKRIAFDPESELHRKLAARLDALMAEVRDYELPFVITEYEMPVEQRPDLMADRPTVRKRHVKTLTPDQIERLRSLGYIE